MVVDYERDAWFAGFTDGEACFMLALKRQAMERRNEIVRYEVIGVQPWLQIGLRADDAAILNDLARTFGGHARYAKATGGGERKARFIWTVSAKADLLGLLRYYDAFPLRAKKARDYAIWREAVAIYCRHGARDERLPELRDALMGGRAFEAEAATPLALQVVA